MDMRRNILSSNGRFRICGVPFLISRKTNTKRNTNTNTKKEGTYCRVMDLLRFLFDIFIGYILLGNILPGNCQVLLHILSGNEKFHICGNSFLYLFAISFINRKRGKCPQKNIIEGAPNQS